MVKPIALIQVPNQRLFGPKAAAQYLGMHEQTLRKLSDLGQIKVLNQHGRRAYRLEDLDLYIESLPAYDTPGAKPGQASHAEDARS